MEWFYQKYPNQLSMAHFVIEIFLCHTKRSTSVLVQRLICFEKHNFFNRMILKSKQKLKIEISYPLGYHGIKAQRVFSKDSFNERNLMGINPIRLRPKIN